MQITSIEDINNKKVRIFLENGFSFVIYKGEVRLYKLKVGESILPDVYDEIINKLLPKRAKLRAMNLLKVRPYTVKGLRDKLVDGEYPEEAITAAIEYVSSYHYLDDYQYAIDFIETYKDRKNKVRLKSDLILKGVERDLIERAISEVFENDENDYDEEQINAYMRKKHFDPENASYDDKMKILAYLCRKGYSYERLFSILNL